MDKFRNEAKKRFGNTDAYKEFEKRTANYTDADFADSSKGLNVVLKEFANCKTEGNLPSSPQAQALVKKLQNFITENFYTCTDEILKGLGTMYTADQRFKENIDKNGEGTAEFISSAIKFHCNSD